MSGLSRHILPNDVSVYQLECEHAFNGLELSQKLYAHYLSRAAWFGGLIVYIQTSPESLGIYILMNKLFSTLSSDKLRQIALDSGLSDDDYKAVTVYASGLFANSGNYKSFGDTKFIPNLSQEKFEKLILAAGDDAMKKIWTQVADSVYSLTDRQRELGLSPTGVTTYLSSNCDIKDAEFVKDFLTAKDISAYNTRLFKTVDQSTGKASYEVRLASVETDGTAVPGMPDNIIGNHVFTSPDLNMTADIRVTKGDYSQLMAKVVENLAKAKEYASTDEEKLMLDDYCLSFTTGSIPAHMDGSRHWIKNMGPIVEIYIGFIESYRDPCGARGEFEGFVAVVNKKMSAKFTELVASAEGLLKELPWPLFYEKDTFLKPDFTSLDVLTFSGSGVPAGINIPNYDEIRQNEGFKNVSLGNVICCGYKDIKVSFLHDADKELYSKLRNSAFEVQVGLHELLGHGSGKLFCEDENGTLNFDQEIVVDLITGEKVTSWYKDNEKWTGVFSVIASSYEECRAECVGLYLCLNQDVLKIFGHVDLNDASDIVYVNWLNMVRAGLLALEFFTPATNSWGQAHMQGRYCILRVLLEAGQDFVKIKETTGDDGKPDLCIQLDRSKIKTVGKQAIGKFLLKLQAYKTTADFDRGKAMFDHYSAVNDDKNVSMLAFREIVLARKLPRRMLVQHNTRVEDDDVVLLRYEESSEGLIKSFVDRFHHDDLNSHLLQLWHKDQEHFVY